MQVQPQAEQSQVVIRLVMYLNEKENLDWLTNLKTKFSIIHHPPLNLRRIRFMIQIPTWQEVQNLLTSSVSINIYSSRFVSSELILKGNQITDQSDWCQVKTKQSGHMTGSVLRLRKARKVDPEVKHISLSRLPANQISLSDRLAYVPALVVSLASKAFCGVWRSPNFKTFLSLILVRLVLFLCTGGSSARLSLKCVKWICIHLTFQNKRTTILL